MFITLIRSTHKLRSDWTEFCWLAISSKNFKDFADVYCAVRNPEVSYTWFNLWLVSARGGKVWCNAFLDVIDLCYEVKGRVIFSLFLCKLALKHCQPSVCANRNAAGVLHLNIAHYIYSLSSGSSIDLFLGCTRRELCRSCWKSWVFFF